MISSIASAYAEAADHGQTEPHLAWRLAWQRLRDDWALGQRAGPHQLGPYLADVPGDDRQAAALDLIAEHLRLSWGAGCGASLDSYLAGLADGFAWLCDPSSVPADLVEDEFVARSTPPFGDQPMLAHYIARFPHRVDVMHRLQGRCLAEQRFVKLRVLGTGLLGVVHQAFDRAGQRLVAIKESSAFAWGDDSSPLLFHEASLTAELQHPGIVPIYDLGRNGDRAYVVMAFIEGRTLAEHIGDYHAKCLIRPGAENRRLLEQLMELVIQLCDAVAYAHERGILHRDIKPGNVIVDPTGRAIIVDWGLARRLGPCDSSPLIPDAAAAAPPTIAGTPQYMAPEQAAGREEPASDIFSLGAVLYEVLTGRPPLEGSAGSLPGNRQQHAAGDWLARSIEQVRAPSRLRSILAQALAREPSHRYRSAADLGDALRAHLAAQHEPRGWFARLFAAE
jgi:hypothetical protein